MDSQVGDGHQSQTSEVDTPNFASDGYEHEPRSITLIFCELMHVFFWYPGIKFCFGWYLT